MLDELVAHHGTGPVGLAGSAHVDILVMDGRTGAIGAPAPDIAVGPVGSGLARIEGAAVQHPLMTVLRPMGTRVAEAFLQALETAGHHVLDLAAPARPVALAVHEVPPVPHLEDVRAFTHAVPNHVEGAHMLPGPEVGGLEVGEFQVAGNDHVPQAVVGLEHLRIAEVVARVAEVIPLQGPEQVLGPGLEIRGGSPQHHLAVGAVAVVAGVVDVVQTVCLIVHAAAGSDSGILFQRGSAGGKDFTQRGIAGTVLRGNAPDRMEIVGAVVLELLQVEDFVLARFRIPERHRVPHPADGGGIVRIESFVVSAGEIGGRGVPVAGSVAVFFLAASHRQGSHEEDGGDVCCSFHTAIS